MLQLLAAFPLMQAISVHSLFFHVQDDTPDNLTLFETFIRPASAKSVQCRRSDSNDLLGKSGQWL